MLAKSHRIPSCIVRDLVKRGHKYSDSGFQLISATNNLPLPRFAFIVPYSVDKRASKRIRLKRLMSESVRLSDKDLIKGSDVIIILRKKRENSTIKTMKTEIGALLKKSGLL